jgi:hypothetical protein
MKLKWNSEKISTYKTTYKIIEKTPNAENPKQNSV